MLFRTAVSLVLLSKVMSTPSFNTANDASGLSGNGGVNITTQVIVLSVPRMKGVITGDILTCGTGTVTKINTLQ